MGYEKVKWKVFIKGVKTLNKYVNQETCDVDLEDFQIGIYTKTTVSKADTELLERWGWVLNTRNTHLGQLWEWDLDRAEKAINKQASWKEDLAAPPKPHEMFSLLNFGDQKEVTLSLHTREPKGDKQESYEASFEGYERVLVPRGDEHWTTPAYDDEDPICENKKLIAWPARKGGSPGDPLYHVPWLGISLDGVNLLMCVLIEPGLGEHPGMGLGVGESLQMKPGSLRIGIGIG